MSGSKLETLLRAQWTEAAQDWIETDQVARTGMLDSWMLDALGDVSGKKVIDIGCGEGPVLPDIVRRRRRDDGR